MGKSFLIDFSGEFQLETIELLLFQVKEKLNDLEVNTIVKKKIVNVLIECMENIYKYTKLRIEGEYTKINFHSKVSLEKKGNSYFVTAGNTILNSDIGKLKDKIEKVNSLRNEGLKQYYKEVINNGEFSNKGGAGLGIIDMVIKSGNPVVYKFTKENDKLSFYEITVEINETNN